MTGSGKPRPREWLSLAVLAMLSLAFGWAAVSTEAPPVSASGPVVAVPEAAPPTPLPDVQPKGAP